MTDNPPKMKRATRDAIERIRTALASRKDDRAYWADKIGASWLVVMDDPATKRGSLVALAEEHFGEYGITNPDILHRALRIHVAGPIFADADAWYEHGTWRNPNQVEPWRSVKLLTQFMKVMRIKNSGSDPNRVPLGKEPIDNVSRVIQGDCRTVLMGLPSESVHVVMTSPPYHGMRDFGHPDQIGMEESIEDYIYELVKVFTEVKRVLKKSGTCYIVIDDRYARARTLSQWGDMTKSQYKSYPSMIADKNLPLKNLALLPERLMIALQNNGWYVRAKVIWQKNQGGYENAPDRPAHCYETVIMLTKSQSYHYNQDAEREPSLYPNATTQRAGDSGETPVPHETKPPFDVWRIAPATRTAGHSAVFPEELVRKCLALSGFPGAHVLDPFAGSGTVGVVAKNLGMTYTLIELNEEHCKLADTNLA